jgi:antitoxin PrlF
MQKLGGNSMQQAKVTYKGQITIPKAVRKALNIQEGDSVTLKIEGDHAILKPLKKKALSDFFGAFPATRPYPGNTELRKEVGHKIGKRLGST